MKPSPYQVEIYKGVRQTDKNILVKATAGSGKTTTILECLNFVPHSKRSLFVSFSNTIVKELRERAPKRVKVSTLHSIGFSILKGKNKRLKLDEYKFFKPVFEFLREKNEGKEGKQKLKQKEVYVKTYKTLEIINGIRLTFCDLNPETVKSVCKTYNLDYDDEQIEIAIELVQENKKGKMFSSIDFADMVYLPAVLENLELPQYDIIFYDEVQDANKAQLILVERLLSMTGRLICVGDPYQAIYGFTFSDVRSIKYLEDRKNTIVLPLSVCYRCAKSIVKEAQRVNDQIKPFEGKEEGIVRYGSIDEVENGDFILSRNTKPLITVYFQLLSQNIPCKLLGKDYRDKLIRLYSLASDDSYISDKELISVNLDERLEALEIELIEKGREKPKEDNRYLTLQEQVVILKIILSLNEPETIVKKISSMFDEDSKGVTLMTIHRSKGLETDRVFFIERSDGKVMIPSDFATQKWQLEQERNLEFVGITRAKKELIYVRNVDNLGF